MVNFLCLLLSLSISGGVLVLFVALLNRLLRGKIPRSFLCCLWPLVLARFLLPVGASWSVTNRVLGAFQETQAQFTPSVGTPTTWEPIWEESPSVEPDGSYVPAAPSLDETPAPIWIMPPAATVLIVVWGSGVLAFLGWRLYSYHRLNRALIEGEMPVADWELELYSGLAGERCTCPALRRSEVVQSPMLAGVLRPVVWLPADSLDAAELSYVLRHELTHWRRHDRFGRKSCVKAETQQSREQEQIKGWPLQGIGWLNLALSTFFAYPPEIRKIIYTTNIIEGQPTIPADYQE